MEETNIKKFKNTERYVALVSDAKVIEIEQSLKCIGKLRSIYCFRDLKKKRIYDTYCFLCDKHIHDDMIWHFKKEHVYETWLNDQTNCKFCFVRDRNKCGYQNQEKLQCHMRKEHSKFEKYFEISVKMTTKKFIKHMLKMPELRRDQDFLKYLQELVNKLITSTFLSLLVIFWEKSDHALFEINKLTYLKRCSVDTLICQENINYTNIKGRIKHDIKYHEDLAILFVVDLKTYFSKNMVEILDWVKSNTCGILRSVWKNDFQMKFITEKKQIIGCFKCLKRIFGINNCFFVKNLDLETCLMKFDNDMAVVNEKNIPAICRKCKNNQKSTWTDHFYAKQFEDIPPMLSSIQKKLPMVKYVSNLSKKIKNEFQVQFSPPYAIRAFPRAVVMGTTYELRYDENEKLNWEVLIRNEKISFEHWNYWTKRGLMVDREVKPLNLFFTKTIEPSHAIFYTTLREKSSKNFEDMIERLLNRMYLPKMTLPTMNSLIYNGFNQDILAYAFPHLFSNLKADIAYDKDGSKKLKLFKGKFNLKEFKDFTLNNIDNKWRKDYNYISFLN